MIFEDKLGIVGGIWLDCFGWKGVLACAGWVRVLDLLDWKS